ncbi:ABC transporter permease [Egicoccus sp. AB-alg6-2]|uniref:ABC transporter permease n=1 Tax=Egicoccus sp. AB-alg6-2 TaxID=3242692 RepID=UPI00359CCB53
MTAGVLAQASRPLLEWDWVAHNRGWIWEQALQHLYFTAVAVTIGLAISLVLALIGLRWRWTLAPILGFGGVLYTIPSLALFALLVPFFGITDRVAIIALITYTILILVRNITSGIDGVPSEVLEAADGMGYRRGRRFVEIELPLALPVIVAGLRIASVTVIGLVTVTALLGRGGLGFFILRGFRTTPAFPTMIVVGTLLSVVLAIAVDVLLLGLERFLTPWARRRQPA